MTREYGQYVLSSTIFECQPGHGSCVKGLGWRSRAWLGSRSIETREEVGGGSVAMVRTRFSQISLAFSPLASIRSPRPICPESPFNHYSIITSSLDHIRNAAHARATSQNLAPNTGSWSMYCILYPAPTVPALRYELRDFGNSHVSHRLSRSETSVHSILYPPY